MPGEEESLPRFQLSLVDDNADGWGPVSLPHDLEDIPYAPFSKNDKLGRVADWTQTNTRSGRQFENYRDKLYNTGVQNQMFSFYQEEDESSFHLVKSRASAGFRQQSRQTTRGGRTFQRTYQRLDRRQNRQQSKPITSSRGGRGGVGGRRFQSWRDYEKPQKLRESSVEVRADWAILEDIDFTRLAKLNFEPREPHELKSCGVLEAYDKNYDKVTTKTEKPLRQINRTFHNVSTSEDPEILKFAESGAANVFAIDTILALLMTCSRSVYSWDVVINRVGKNLFFDKRERSSIDFWTVNETAIDVTLDDKDGINAPDALALEATYINHNFSQQVLRPDERYEFEHPNPFAESGDDVASVGYRYRQWNLGEGVNLISRCEVDGVLKTGNSDAYLTIKCLNEFDPKVTGVDWRQRLDSQRGAVLATELKNNSSKLARWTAQALLAGADNLKLGYVSRVSPRDNTKHVILGTQIYKPSEFATQINLNMANAWGIVKTLVDMCLKLPEGRYLLLKDPNKPTMRLYKVPADSFDGNEAAPEEDGAAGSNAKNEEVAEDDEEY